MVEVLSNFTELIFRAPDLPVFFAFEYAVLSLAHRVEFLKEFHFLFDKVFHHCFDCGVVDVLDLLTLRDLLHLVFPRFTGDTATLPWFTNTPAGISEWLLQAVGRRR